MIVTPERLLAMRDSARTQRNTMLEHRSRGGQDPAWVLSEVPEIDDLVVIALRDELLESRDQFADFSMIRFASRMDGPNADELRIAADRVEFELMREIAAAVPDLTAAVWRMSGRLRV